MTNNIKIINSTNLSITKAQAADVNLKNNQAQGALDMNPFINNNIINNEVFSLNRINKSKVREESQELLSQDKLNTIVNKLISNEVYEEIADIKVNKTLKYIESLRAIDFKLAKDLYQISPFNKSFPIKALSANNKHRLNVFQKPFEIANNLIKLTFLSMGTLISVPKYSITYSNINLQNILQTKAQGASIKKINIQLFYFVKAYRYRNYKNFINFEHNIIDQLELIEDVGTAHVENVESRNNLLITFNNKCEYLVYFLSKLFDAEIELELTRIDRTFFESNILAQDLAIKSLDHRFVKLALLLFKKAPTMNPNKYFTIIKKEMFPSRIAGIYIKVAGRAFNQKIIPKLTFKEMQKGTIVNHNIRLVDKGRFTSKSRRGSYTFTVKIAHIIKYT